MKFMHMIGNIIARILLTVVFIVLVLPTGIVRRIMSDPLRLSIESKGWVKKPDIEDVQESARRQF